MHSWASRALRSLVGHVGGQGRSRAGSCMLSLLLLLCAMLASATVEAVHVARLPCGATIPIDSQFLFDPVWSLSLYRQRVRAASGVDLQVTTQPFAAAVRNVITAEAGMDPNAVTVFRLGTPLGSGSSVVSSGGEEEGWCAITVHPLAAAMAGTRSTAARLLFLSVRNTTAGGCPASALTVRLAIGGAETSVVLGLPMAASSSSAGLLLSQSLSIGADGEDIAWPASLAFPSSCEVDLLLLTNRHGRIDVWYAWIPATVYTAVVTAFMLPALLVNRRMPTGLIALEMIVVFLGYLGACIGLVIELICWQSAVGRMFPFPSSVTLYACLTVLHALYLIPLACRQQRGYHRVLLMGVLRLLVYGLNCALCVGYWVSGYVLLGSLALFQYVATNAILTFYFAWVTVRLRNVSLDRGPVKFAHVFTYLWFAPATPFAACGLLYTDLFAITRFGETRKPEEARVRDVVCVYNAQMSLPLLFFQNIYGVALVAAASAFHMPFLVVLFVAVWLFSLHLVCACDAYVAEYRRWHRRGVAGLPSFTRCGWLWLTPIMDYLLLKEGKVDGGRGERGQGIAEELHDAARAARAAVGGGVVNHEGTFRSPAGSADRLSSRNAVEAAPTSTRRRQPRQQSPPQHAALSPWSPAAYPANTDSVHVRDAAAAANERIYFPPIPPPSTGVDRGRHAWEDPMEEAEEAYADADGARDDAELATPSDQRADVRADAQYWPASVER